MFVSDTAFTVPLKKNTHRPLPFVVLYAEQVMMFVSLMARLNACHLATRGS